VIETMRPLPLASGGEAIPGLAGIACVRGAAVPVLDLATLLGAPARPPRRLVTLRVATRTVGLLVEEVEGLVHVDPAADMEALPPLLQGLAGGAVEAIHRADRELALVLTAARLLPEGATLHAGG